MSSRRSSKHSAQPTRNLNSKVLLPSSRQTGTKTRGKPPVVFADVIEISSDEEEDRPPPPTKRKDPPKSSADVAHLERELKRLREENAALTRKHTESRQELEICRKEKNKNSMTIDVSELEDFITCEICALKLWTPCILPDCGHTFCQTCLQDWFSTTLLQHMQTHPHYTPNQRLPANIQHMIAIAPQLLHQYVGLLPPQPNYTCPTCRASVKSRPTESFSLKAVVRAVAKVQRESSPRKLTTNRGTGRGTASNDGPWDGFFPRD
ncbi:hypothetical protein L218DRAFT_531260 [Marasmius fiardii PR-910]|nr:hypothetical protein L218DRAFT_531260 [Marasmius fiardii PR-910]